MKQPSNSPSPKGYGDYKNIHDPEWISMEARVEVFAALAHVSRIAEAIMGAAHAGLDNDGIVTVLPVEALYRVREYRSSGDTGQDGRPSPESQSDECVHQLPRSPWWPDTNGHRPEQQLPKKINPRREIGLDEEH